jgi:transposase-like protein
MGSCTNDNGRGSIIVVKSKYNREYIARQDKQQATLNPNSPSFIKPKQEKVIPVTTLYTGKYMCPFCLHIDKIEAYLISAKKGYDKRLGHCPECQQNMMIKTLTAEMSPEEFAEFVYGYRSSGFWQKCQFTKFNHRLAMLGWLERFWFRYKELKGNETNESYQDHIMRQQEEEAIEKGWKEQ